MLIFDWLFIISVFIKAARPLIIDLAVAQRDTKRSSMRSSTPAKKKRSKQRSQQTKQNKQKQKTTDNDDHDDTVFAFAK